MKETTDRLAGALGIVWAIAILVVTFAAGAPPDIAGSAGDIRAYIIDNRGVWMASGVVYGLTLPLLLSFFLSLTSRLRVVNTTGRMASSATLTGLVFGITFLFLPMVFVLPLAVDRSLAEAASDDLLRIIWAVAFSSTMAGNIGFGIALSGIASAGEGAPLAAPLRWAAGLVGAILIVVSAIGLANTDAAMIAAAGIALVCLWVIATGVHMLGIWPGKVAVRVTSG